jgi:putative acetyltransferase
MIIRPEKQGDEVAIEQVTHAAFAEKPYSDQTEPIIIRRLREAGALALSLVAEMDGQIVGHVAFSAVTIDGEDKGWLGLGPVSVKPGLQRKGIGSQLIREGLARVREMGAKGCVLEGDPNYYKRFGFQPYQGLIYHGSPSPEFFMALAFYEDVPHGSVEYHSAFYNNRMQKEK